MTQASANPVTEAAQMGAGGRGGGARVGRRRAPGGGARPTFGARGGAWGRARARPMPREAPVTSAIRPSSGPAMAPSILCRNSC